MAFWPYLFNQGGGSGGGPLLYMTEVGSVDISTQSVVFPVDRNGYAIDPDRGLLFFTSRTQDTISAWDISDPTNPTFISKRTDSVYFNNISGIDIDPVQEHLFVNAGDSNRFYVLDISDAGLATLPDVGVVANGSLLDDARGLVWDSARDVVFSHASDDNAIANIDVSNRMTPVANTIRRSASSATVHLRYVPKYQTLLLFPTLGTSIVAYDMSDLDATGAGNYTGVASLQYAYDAFIDEINDVMYVSHLLGNGITVWDISNLPTSMTEIASLTDATSGDPEFVDMRGMTGDPESNVCYASNRTAGNSVFTIDRTDPYNPQILNSYNPPSTTGFDILIYDSRGYLVGIGGTTVSMMQLLSTDPA